MALLIAVAAFVRQLGWRTDKTRSSSNGSSSDDGRQRRRVSSQLDLNSHSHPSRSFTRSQQLIILLLFECISSHRVAGGVVTAAMRVGLMSPVAIGDDLIVGCSALLCFDTSD